MLSEFFVQACEEILLIAAFGLFLATAVYAFFQWNKGNTLISHAGFAADNNGYAGTSLNDDKRDRDDYSLPVNNDILDESVFLKPKVDSELPVESTGENLFIPSEEQPCPEMLTEAIGRRNYSAVGRMADRGLTSAQIANELGIPRGEVNLVLKLKGLYGGGYNIALPLEATYSAAS